MDEKQQLSVPLPRTQQKYNILIVDDSRELNLLIKMILEKLGHTVHFVENGTQAIVTCSKMKPDILFLDMQLPDLPGSEVAKRIAKKDSHTPLIIGLTGHNPDDIAHELIDAPISFCLQKPMGFDSLVNTLTNAINRAFNDHWTH